MIPLKSRILCVDDEPAILRLLEALLIKNGYEVIKAGKVEISEARMYASNPDLFDDRISK